MVIVTLQQVVRESSALVVPDKLFLPSRPRNGLMSLSTQEVDLLVGCWSMFSGKNLWLLFFGYLFLRVGGNLKVILIWKKPSTLVQVLCLVLSLWGGHWWEYGLLHSFFAVLNWQIEWGAKPPHLETMDRMPGKCGWISTLEGFWESQQNWNFSESYCLVIKREIRG